MENESQSIASQRLDSGPVSPLANGELANHVDVLGKTKMVDVMSRGSLKYLVYFEYGKKISARPDDDGRSGRIEMSCGDQE